MLAELNTIAKNYEYLIKAIGAFLPFLIAIFMAYVAYQQWQTNERKRKQDLFDKRLELFNVLLNFFEGFNREDPELSNIEPIEFLYINSSIGYKVRFLFDEAIEKHILNIGEMGLNYDTFVEPFNKYLCVECSPKKNKGVKSAN